MRFPAGDLLAVLILGLVWFLVELWALVIGVSAGLSENLLLGVSMVNSLTVVAVAVIAFEGQ